MINIYFITRLVRSLRQHDLIWVNIDKMTNISPLFAGTDYSFGRGLCNVIHSGVMILHGVPILIILDKGAQFTAQFWNPSRKVLVQKRTYVSLFVLRKICKKSVLSIP